MKAMILAAGRGERMRPLTDHTPKPLLQVAGVPLIEHHIHRLAAAGWRDLVINVSHLAEQIEDYCGGGERWGVAIAWSREASPLETAGGIFKALPLLGNKPFLVVNGDVWTDYPVERLWQFRPRQDIDAHLVLVDSPPQHPLGDFLLDQAGLLQYRGEHQQGLTYAGVGVYTPAYFEGMAAGVAPLRPMLDGSIARQRLSGEYYRGRWQDVGTPARLQQLDQAVRAAADPAYPKL